MEKDIYAFAVHTIDGKEKSLSDYRGKVLLIVNVASKCGYTPQYKGLEELHKMYAPRGLCVLGFPANEFGGQEPGSNQEIQQFCSFQYGVDFDMFAKVKVKGEGMHPLFDALQNDYPDLKGAIRWNFHKFLIDKKGRPIARFDSKVDPLSDELKQAIENAIKG